MIPTLPKAPVKERTIAGLIDAGLCCCYVVVLGIVVAVVFPHVIGSAPLWVNCMLGFAFIDAPLIMWFWRQESVASTSMGKRLQGLRVVRVGTGEALTPTRAGVRTVAKFLPWVCVHMLLIVGSDPRMASWAYLLFPACAIVAALGLLGLVTGYVRMDHRAFHDLCAGTQCIVA